MCIDRQHVQRPALQISLRLLDSVTDCVQQLLRVSREQQPLHARYTTAAILNST
jgi:hypothetical protein